MRAISCGERSAGETNLNPGEIASPAREAVSCDQVRVRLVRPASICKMSPPRAPSETSFMAGVSPLAPERFPELPPIAGVRLAAYAAGVRYQGRNDLMLAELAPGSTIAGVLTRSQMPGQPVIWCRECLPGGK